LWHYRTRILKPQGGIVNENRFKRRANQKNIRNVLAGAGKNPKREKETKSKAVSQSNYSLTKVKTLLRRKEK
jgi:hypothetical protein